MTRVLMLQGTGSDVGKSVLVAGLARALLRRGLKVMPFKPQNMSNNAAIAKEDGEIGRAQWLQAVAAGEEPSVHMNPVLLKPHSDVGAQIVVQGKVWGRADAADYQTKRQDLMAAVLESFAHLKEQADIVLVEGAGSPAETNLRLFDIANMGFATVARAPVILVGDIDRGGVIASLVGTHTVLNDEDRHMIAGFIINKFRGDVRLFDKGLEEITARTRWPSFGVLPWLPVIRELPAEDAVVLDAPAVRKTGQIKVAVPMLSRIANFDDVDPLRGEASVDLSFVSPGQPLPGDADLVILPGTKATIADLGFFRAQGWDVDLAAHVRRGGHVLGLCGGFQMLGTVIIDPAGREGEVREAKGLGFLDMRTHMTDEKKTKEVTGTRADANVPFHGYEIHIGETKVGASVTPFLNIDGAPHGAVSADGRIMGAYVHGLLDDGKFRADFLRRLGAQSDGVTHRVKVENALDRLGNAMEAELDIDGLLKVAACFPLV
ncbi:MAG: cobyric acid synthase [Parvibaculum sp.]